MYSGGTRCPRVECAREPIGQTRAQRGGYGKAQSVVIISGLSAPACIRSHSLAPNSHPGSRPACIVSSPGRKYQRSWLCRCVRVASRRSVPDGMTVVAQTGLTEAPRMRSSTRPKQPFCVKVLCNCFQKCMRPELQHLRSTELCWRSQKATL